MDIRLFTVSQNSDVFIPKNYELIQSGVDLTDTPFKEAHRDNVGENISFKNLHYCELTAQYWVWKNVKADAYGFFHYRRYLNLNRDCNCRENDWQILFGGGLEEETANYFDLGNIATYKELLTVYDVILPKKTDVTRLPSRYHTVREQYVAHPDLKEEDIQILLKIIKDNSPEYYEDAVKTFEGSVTYFCNMFVMKEHIMNEYFTWLFNILELFEVEFIKQKARNVYGLRTPAHLSERMLTIFIQRKMRIDSEFKVKELDLVFFEKPVDIVRPLTGYIPIVFCINNKLVGQLQVVLQSIYENTQSNNKIHIIVLGNELESQSVNDVELQIKKFGYACSIIDMTKKLSKQSLTINQHLSIETYYRFFVQEICKGYSKVIYLDVDLIVNDDIAKLYQIDLKTNAIAAAIDPDMHGLLSEGANRELLMYTQSTLGIQKPYMYFQAGVLIINPSAMSKVHSLNEWLTLCSKGFKWMDQDILNKELKGQILRLSQNWNCLANCNGQRVKIAERGTVDVYTDYLKARKSPNIIHYAGEEKPWNNPSMDMAHYFWCYAFKARSKLLFQSQHKPSHGISNGFEEKILRIKVIERFFPPYSRSRKMVLKYLPNSFKSILKKLIYS